MPRRRFCFCGDLFIWAAPNAGNPQKVQRYPEEWALNARKIAALRPRIVFPGHGPPIIGKFRFCTVYFSICCCFTGACIIGKYFWK
jgi:glyoxylase-like metal-dependent hydrolase (beta-lactamase superfamily II)